MDRNHLNNFERRPTKDHSCEVWSKSNQWFRRRCLKIVDGCRRRRSRRRRTVGDHNSSPWAFGSGELKTTNCHLVMQFLDMDCCTRWPSCYKALHKSTSLMHFSAGRFSAILFSQRILLLWLPDLLISHLASFVKGFYSIRKCFAHKERKFPPFKVYCFSDILLFLYFRENNACHFKWFTSSVILFPLKKQKWNSDFLLLQLGLALRVNLQQSEG